MSLLSKYSKTVIAIVTLACGTVLGAAAQDIIDSSFRLLGAMTVVLLSGIVGLVTVEAGIAESRRDTDKKIVADAKAVLDDTRQSIGNQGSALDILSENMHRSMRSLEAQFGMRVERLLLEDVNSMDVLDSDASAQMIYSVKRELYVLDILSEDGRWPDEAMKQDLVSQYFTGLMERIRQSSPPITYKRIFQVPSPVSFPCVSNMDLIDHCRDVLALHQERRHRASMKVARRRFPFKVILIDGDCLIIQLQEYDPTGSAFRLWGELRITDPQRDLVSVFKEIWDQIDNESRVLTESDLPAITHSAADEISPNTE